MKVAPLFENVETFSMSDLRPKYSSVTGVVGGFPCQAYLSAVHGRSNNTNILFPSSPGDIKGRKTAWAGRP